MLVSGLHLHQPGETVERDMRVNSYIQCKPRQDAMVGHRRRHLCLLSSPSDKIA